MRMISTIYIILGPDIVVGSLEIQKNIDLQGTKGKSGR